ncbi:transporter substrate-binding domain-containing protein [Oscillibacter sp.]|uniref:transporter substrate-binding domain-containing protein n=1 Tax=Oscillibacter sp. TaxID=1945593 RepID=UPI0028B0D596|nr:transporter substrate-binding domain-containing protein [Oscillibacter sp.]
MHSSAFSKRHFLQLYLLSILIVVLLTAQIANAVVQGGWFAGVPEVRIVADNSYERTLRVVGDIDFAPYSSVTVNGSYTGHDIECINEVANRLGVNVDIYLTTWTKATKAVKNGNADIIMGLESISNRNDGLMITSIVADDAFVVYGKAPISGVDDLKQGRIAILNGNTEVDIYGIEENAVRYDTYSEELEALEAGEIDYAVMRASVAKMLIQQQGYADLLQVFAMMDSGLGLGVREGEKELAAELDQAIREMQLDGTLSSLQRKWLTTYVFTRSLPEVLQENSTFYLVTTCVILLSAAGIGALIQKERASAREALAEQELALSQAALAIKEAELADGRSRIILSQIQPHFLFNALGTIGQLCRKDSEQAAIAIDTFARYLRTNLESVENTKMVPFTQELQHIKTYLWLETMRFGEDLKVVYDVVCENFYLPPLTVQPIVENAVKHGLGHKEEGGTVTVRSRELESVWLVQIEDDGIGFDEKTVLEDSRIHIGIENVRRRLQFMCSGSLSIASSANKGTVVTIRIPKNK